MSILEAWFESFRTTPAGQTCQLAVPLGCLMTQQGILRCVPCVGRKQDDTRNHSSMAENLVISSNVRLRWCDLVVSPIFPTEEDELANTDQVAIFKPTISENQGRVNRNIEADHVEDCVYHDRPSEHLRLVYNPWYKPSSPLPADPTSFSSRL